MTPSELDELITDCPALFHMAERGSWPAIQRHGLLSTTALLDLYGLCGEAREALESRHRLEGTTLAAPGMPPAKVRDQKPMDDAGLRRCLPPTMAPSDWYRLLNNKVFFWLNPARLGRLLGARPYRGSEHDVIELATGSLVEAYRAAITLSPINSGSTRPFGVKRGPETFSTIDGYDYAFWRHKRPRRERVVELAVTGGIPDIIRFVKSVTRRRGTEIISVLG